MIGREGFDYERNEKGELEKFPHPGGGRGNYCDNLHIGANACIARGSLEDTVISEGTKIDQLVHISHNVKIGKYCLITNSLYLCWQRGRSG
jgi:UDP-3-O-[3-hydroxymyristoyl] glucosamine N-acyltransferase